MERTGIRGMHAVVTGASSGIGRCIAVSLARAGAAKVLVHFRANREGADRTAATIRDSGCECEVVAADLASAGDVDRLVREAWDRLGSISAWINNAGADVLTGAAADLDFRTKLQHLLSVDLVGTIQLSRDVGERMRHQSLSAPGSITFLGWDQAVEGMEGDAGQMFAPTKAAVTAFAASLAQTLAPDVRVNTVAPGWIRTAWGQSTSGYWDRRARRDALMGRWGTPEDVAAAVLYAADPAHSFVTGQVLEVNGGWNRRYDD